MHSAKGCSSCRCTRLFVAAVLSYHLYRSHSLPHAGLPNCKPRASVGLWVCFVKTYHVGLSALKWHNRTMQYAPTKQRLVDCITFSR